MASKKSGQSTAAAKPDQAAATKSGQSGTWRALSTVGWLCCVLVVAYFSLCVYLASQYREHDPRTEVAESGSCLAKGGSCSDEQWWAEGEQGLSYEHLLRIDTLNFNATVANASQRALLVAFFDPRSQSFKDLRQHLEDAARALSEFEASGSPIGQLGVCDVTVNTYLGHVEAPELSAGWQEFREAAFKFGRPRFFPLIVVIYEGGKRLREYTGVLSAKHIAGFLQRQSTARGGEALADPAALRALLKRSGPFALGCGLEDGSAELGAFGTTARDLHGQLIFGLAPASVCEEVLGLRPIARPHVAWVDGGGMGRVRSSSEGAELLESAEALSEWLSSHRAELLEEMTPDTSYKYLDNAEPLLIFLVDPGDKAAWESGVSVLSSLEHLLTGNVQMVWSDCLVFGPQFGAKGKCPLFVVVETQGMTWRKMPLRSLEEPQPSGKAPQNSSTRLLAWLRNATGMELNGASRKKTKAAAKSADDKAPSEAPGSGRTTAPSSAQPRSSKRAPKNATKARGARNDSAASSEDSPTSAATARGDGSQGAGAGKENQSSQVVKGLTEGVEEDFMETMPELDPAADVLFVWTHYQSALLQLLQLQVSYESRYGRRLPFDFSDLQKAQKLHPSMRSLASSPSALQRQLQDPQKLLELRRAIEWKAGFEFNASSAKIRDSEKGSYLTRLRRGYDMVRGVFLRLFQHLHHHAGASTIGIPEAKTQAVERRAASGLSVSEFVEKYAKPGRPVIITGTNITEEDPWTLDFFRRRCNVTAEYMRKNALKWSWGRLESAGSLPLAEFLDSFTSNETRRAWYLHDWSLPRNCPAVFGPPPYRGFTVPKYFAGDYFQRAAFDGYQHTWPSLFVGSEETQSAMHIDSGGTNFWLYLLSGRKEWRFFSRRDLVSVYQSPLHAHFLADAFAPDFKKFPLLKYAEMFVGVQEPGEIMFIPGGNPHAVRNLEPIHGVSMNYVDASNVWIHLWHMLAEGKWQSFEMFTDGATFPHGLRAEQQPMRFGDWKSTRWKDFAYDIH